MTFNTLLADEEVFFKKATFFKQIRIIFKLNNRYFNIKQIY